MWTLWGKKVRVSSYVTIAARDDALVDGILFNNKSKMLRNLTQGCDRKRSEKELTTNTGAC
jgi:hypothetical protein